MKRRQWISMFLAILLVLSAAPFTFAEGDTYTFDLITQVYDYGQRTCAVIIDAKSDVLAASVDATSFAVSALKRTVEGELYYEGARPVTNVYVSAENALGAPAAYKGRYIVVEIEASISRDEAGVWIVDGSMTYSGNQRLDMTYSIEQLKAFTLADGARIEGAQFVQEDIVNLLVDEFAYGCIENEGATLPYRYYDPSNAYAAPEAGYPLVLFLHGGGELGTHNEIQLIANKGATVWMEPELAANNPCYVLAPQTSVGWTDPAVVELLGTLIEEFCATHNVDRDRIYVQGMSMGGIGTWNAVLTYPDIFAAAIVMCGMVPEEWYDESHAADWEAIKFLPIRLFVAADDYSGLVEGTDKAYKKLSGMGSPVFREVWTAGSIIPAHHCWEQVYRIGTHYNWLFQQSRSRSQNLTIDYRTTLTSFDSSEILPGLTTVLDQEMDIIYVIDRGEEALIIDTGMSRGDCYEYIVENVLTQKDADLTIFITHNHGDHTAGLPKFADKAQLKGVYVHELEARATLQRISADKVFFLEDGQIIDWMGEQLYFVVVPGHTTASTVLFVDDVMFTGDAVGSGDLWLNATLQAMNRSLDDFIDDIEAYKAANGYAVLKMMAGHYENKYNFTDSYVYDLQKAIRDTLSGKQTPGVYTRNNALYIGHNFAHAKFAPSALTGADDATYNALTSLIDLAYTDYARLMTALENAEKAVANNGLNTQDANAEACLNELLEALVEMKR